MKPELLAACVPTAADSGAMYAPKIHVLDAGKENWDVIRDIAHSGVQEEAFYVLDMGDIVRKHKEWKLKLPRVQPFYGNFTHIFSSHFLVTRRDERLNEYFNGNR